MPDNTAQEARFDHVNDAGELVFAAGNLKFSVPLDDTLERAVLAAKQVRHERQVASTPRPAPTLPISQIQSLIRAGASPSAVAERYGLNEALVRRFSSAVQTEKTYAIEQFLSVPAPKESHVRFLSDLIDRTLAAAGVDRATLSWAATRRGHDPWHIIATFESAGRKIRGEWTWNMHDNSVACLNSTARKLIGEQSLGVRGADGAAAPVPSVIQPGSFGEGFPIPLAAGDEHAAASTSTSVASGAAGANAAAAGIDRSSMERRNTPEHDARNADGLPSPSLPVARPDVVGDLGHDAEHKTPRLEQLDIYDMEGVVDTEKALMEAAANHANGADVADGVASGVADGTTGVTGNAAGNTNAAGGVMFDAADAVPMPASDPEAATQVFAAQPAPQSASKAGQGDPKPVKPRRKSGRSAVPSWDEILFGE